MKIVILDALTFGEISLEGFNRFGDVEVFQTTSLNETLSRIEDAEIIVTNKVVITERMMAECSGLKLICVAATGMNNIDLGAAEQRGVIVKNVAGYSTDSVIQHTFSMLFYLMGHSRYYDEYVKSREWQRSEIFTHIGRSFSELKGKTWGVVGMGEIGRGVAKIATAFGADVIYYSTSGTSHNRDYPSVELGTLLQNSDIVTIHAPLNDATKNLIGLSELMQLKEGAILLNLGRGGIINEDDLARVLDAREIYAGLDVLDEEPMRRPHPLLGIKQRERLYITPHIAWTSIEARERLITSVIENIKTFLNG